MRSHLHVEQFSPLSRGEGKKKSLHVRVLIITGYFQSGKLFFFFFFANILPTDTEGHKLIPNIKYTRAFLIIIKAKT